MELLVKAIDSDFESKRECKDWPSLFKDAGDIALDIEYKKHDGTIFVFKLPNHSAIMFQTQEDETQMVSPELFYRIHRRNKDLVQKVKSITGDI